MFCYRQVHVISDESCFILAVENLSHRRFVSAFLPVTMLICWKMQMGDPSMARVHKFMALDPSEVGYFISQVGAAASCLGVSSSDVSAVAGVLMQYFGYRCSPPLSITDGPQLQSICEACNCPYDPMAKCGLYDNGGCYPEPMVAPQCAASQAPSGYGSSTYTSETSYPTETSSKGGEYTSTKYWY